MFIQTVCHAWNANKALRVFKIDLFKYCVILLVKR